MWFEYIGRIECSAGSVLRLETRDFDSTKHFTEGKKVVSRFLRITVALRQSRANNQN